MTLGDEEQPLDSDGDTAPGRTDEETEPSSDGDDEESDVSWGKASMAAVLGFEFVGLLVAGLFVGYYIDQYFQTEPVGMLVGLAFGILAAGLHVWRIAVSLMS